MATLSDKQILIRDVFIALSNLFQFWVKLSSFARSTHYDVIGLEPNRTYNFRVRAENQYGVSDPLQADEPITAKFPFTVPDPPGQPRVIDWDTSNATVVWTRPLSDGGSRIQVCLLSINKEKIIDIFYILQFCVYYTTNNRL